MVSKYGKGHILLSDTPDRYITVNRQRHRIDSLPIDERAPATPPHRVSAHRRTRLPKRLQLPDIHRDPFDRIIIAQAIANNTLIVTPDSRITHYPVSVIW